jgi:endoglucanase
MHASSGKEGAHVSKAGWHDAGDYGRYVVNSGITTGTLLMTWEYFNDPFGKVKLNIPESGNGTPDLLNEIRWNLEWMLTMQDTDGGVWHKQTSERFPGFVMPEKDTTISYVIGTGKEPYKSSCATGDFAAVMAMAGRTYSLYDKEFSNRASAAARKAWIWLEKNPDVRFQNPPGVVTGAYGDGNCADERLWAAAELHRNWPDGLTGPYFLANWSALRPQIRAAGPPSWANVGALALWSYAWGRSDEAARAIQADTIAAADEIVKRSEASGYRVSLTSRDYVWGSNAVAANYGMQLLIANRFHPDPKYVEAARDNLHYLLGRNTFSVSWVTGVGENPFHHPHHRPSGADANAEPWPGLLSGGPNRSRQDDAMRAKLPAGLPPAKMWIDDQEAYAANEVAINWNAPLVFLLAGAR